LSRTEEISDRLPHFYRYWEPGSSIYHFIAAPGKCLDEAEKELVSIMRAHWVDTASRGDLDRLGAVYNIKRKESEPDPDFRNRLKIAIISYEGGGTIDAIQMLARIMLRLPQDHPVQIIENPPAIYQENWKGSAGHEWFVTPRSIQETVPEITIAVETADAKVTDPTIINVTTGESITFKGDLLYGDILIIKNGQAMLNDQDHTDRLSTADMPKLPRTESKWQYTESVGANLGTFDSTQFDGSFFEVEIVSSAIFKWTASKAATFELHIPREILTKAGVTPESMQDILNSVKACGVKAEVKVI
jgi:hypothetical protein